MKNRNTIKDMINPANILTSFRIVGAAAIVFIKPLTVPFFVIYTLAGVTDAIDGFVARKMGTQSDMGAKLDSVADLVFYSVMMIKILPILIKKLPFNIWIIVAAVLLLRIAAYVTAALKYRRFAAVHTYLNKVTGAGVFLIPYFLGTPAAAVFCYCVSALGFISSAEELVMHLLSKTYDPGMKSVLKLL